MPSVYRSAIESQIQKIDMGKSAPFSEAGISDKFAIDLLKLSKMLSEQRDGRERCNIIGSGMSALAAVNIRQDFGAAYFTCNFGGILPLAYDLYLIETASHERPEISNLQRDLVFELGDSAGKVLLKNLWEGKISSKYFQKNYKNKNIIYDSLFPGIEEILRHGDTNFLFDVFFYRKMSVMLQIYTSPLTLLQLAVRAGYKNIKIFGLDGRGPHFFHCPSTHFKSSVLQRARKLIPEVDKSVPHKVGYPARRLLPVMSEYLRRKGVQLELVGAK